MKQENKDPVPVSAGNSTLIILLYSNKHHHYEIINCNYPFIYHIS